MYAHTYIARSKGQFWARLKKKIAPQALLALHPQAVAEDLDEAFDIGQAQRLAVFLGRQRQTGKAQDQEYGREGPLHTVIFCAVK